MPRPAPREAPGYAGPRSLAATYPFNFDTLLEDAKRRAAAPYAPQRNSLPAALDKLSPEQYRSIHFNPDAGIWRAENLPFRLELLRAAPQSADGCHRLHRRRRARQGCGGHAGDVRDGGPAPAQLGKVSLPLSGFRVRSRINSNKVWDEFLVFQGASYFRAVAKNLLYGLSARGLAIDTGEPSGEEFPVFTHFWIERPGAHADAIVIYALLESESTTGAYKFTVQPGVETLIDVEMTLFPRAEMRVVGIAPLTSMFLFDETNRGHLDDYRPEVHDSDGLQIATKSGEHIFRPLANPLKLQVSTFTTQAPKGFGLVQRSRQQSDFRGFRRAVRAPAERLDRAPRVIGVRGPSNWSRFPPAARPTTISWLFGVRAAPLTPGHPAQFAYRIIWCAEPPLPKGLGKISRDPLRRQHRRQAARVRAGYRRRRRKARRPAPRSELLPPARISNAALCRTASCMGCARASRSIRATPI